MFLWVLKDCSWNHSTLGIMGHCTVLLWDYENTVRHELGDCAHLFTPPFPFVPVYLLPGPAKKAIHTPSYSRCVRGELTA